MNKHKLEVMKSEVSRELYGLWTAIGQTDGLDCPTEAIGLRVWLLPERYYRLVVTDSLITRSLMDGCALLFARPKLIRAGFLERPGPHYDNAPRWHGRSSPIGRGVVSKTILGGLGVEDDGDPIRHVAKARGPVRNRGSYYSDKKHPCRVDGLRYRQTRYVTTRYSAIIAHQLLPGHANEAFGCVTAHVPFGHSFGTEAAKNQIIQLLGVWSGSISNVVMKCGYELPPRADETVSQIDLRNINDDGLMANGETESKMASEQSASSRTIDRRDGSSGTDASNNQDQGEEDRIPDIDGPTRQDAPAD